MDLFILPSSAGYHGGVEIFKKVSGSSGSVKFISCIDGNPSFMEGLTAESPGRSSGKQGADFVKEYAVALFA
jgi:hypothetical protein